MENSNEEVLPVVPTEEVEETVRTEGAPADAPTEEVEGAESEEVAE